MVHLQLPAVAVCDGEGLCGLCTEIKAEGGEGCLRGQAASLEGLGGRARIASLHLTMCWDTFFPYKIIFLEPWCYQK